MMDSALQMLCSWI